MVLNRLILCIAQQRRNAVVAQYKAWRTVGTEPEPTPLHQANGTTRHHARHKLDIPRSTLVALHNR